MNAPMDRSMRRGACPGLSAPMATGDGLLARLTPAGSTIALDAFAGLCGAARTHGNGIVEITSRGSIQIRGLSAASAPLFAAEVASLGIEASDGIPVVTDPLAGLTDADIFDAHALAAALRKALAAAPFASRLSAKVSVAIDGGAALHLDALAADIRLRPIDGAPCSCRARGRCRDRDAARRRPAGARGRMRRAAVRNSRCDVAAVSHARRDSGRRIERIQIRGRRYHRRWPGSGRASRRRSDRRSSVVIGQQRAGRRPAVRAFGFGNPVALDRGGPSGRRGRAAHRAGPRAAVGGLVARRDAPIASPRPTLSASSSIPPTRAEGRGLRRRADLRIGRDCCARDGARDRRRRAVRCPMARSSIFRVAPRAAPIRPPRLWRCSAATGAATCSSTACCHAP